VMILSSSGNSRNLIEALTTAQKRGLETIALLGRGGGKAKGMATCEIIVPGNSGAAAQECHLFLVHHFCDRIDAEFD
jgi:D-sedoheptulose 7-phosphate isomerase